MIDVVKLRKYNNLYRKTLDAMEDVLGDPEAITMMQLDRVELCIIATMLNKYDNPIAAHELVAEAVNFPNKAN